MNGANFSTQTPIFLPNKIVKNESKKVTTPIVVKTIIASNISGTEPIKEKPTDKASIVNTKFSSSSTFMLGTKILSLEEASNMGLHIENELDPPIKRTLKL